MGVARFAEPRRQRFADRSKIACCAITGVLLSATWLELDNCTGKAQEDELLAFIVAELWKSSVHHAS